MKKLWLIIVLFGLAVGGSSPAWAHTTKTNGTVSVLLHVEPGDKPKAGDKSVLHLFLSDRGKLFDSKQCDCKISIVRKGKVIHEAAAFTEPNRPAEGSAVSAMDFTFSEPGAYKIRLVGKPKDANNFPEFDFSWDQRVDSGIKIDTELSGETKLALGLTAVILVAGVFGRYGLPKLASVKWPAVSRKTVIIMAFIASNVATGVVLYGLDQKPKSAESSHQQHIQSLQSGDKTKRYNVSFGRQQFVEPGAEIPLTFAVTDASTGTPVVGYSTIMEKTAHLIVVDEELNYYNHIHPELRDGQFGITTQFPHNGKYRLYLDFQPVGAAEQQFGFVLSVGSGQVNKVVHGPDVSAQKTFGAYQITLNNLKPSAAGLTSGGQKLAFTFRDNSGLEFKNLKPYLGAFGHLILINQENYEYVHIHPSNMRVAPGASGGPTVEFLPMNLTKPISPGTYRIFGQFNPDGQLMVADYTIEVK